MKYEYLILNTDNEWLATTMTLKAAKIEAKDAIENGNSAEVYIYKAQEVGYYQVR